VKKREEDPISRPIPFRKQQGQHLDNPHPINLNEARLILLFRKTASDPLYSAYEAVRAELTKRTCQDIALLGTLIVISDNEECPDELAADSPDDCYMLHVRGCYDGFNRLFGCFTGMNIACNGRMVLSTKKLLAAYAEIIPEGVLLLTGRRNVVDISR
jgi:hypothetical protein